MEEDYLAYNRENWNNRVPVHLASDFYDVEGFLKNISSLNSIELNLLGDIKGKTILHLQCHFGQDTMSLAAKGGTVVGVDFSDKAIDAARLLNEQLQLDAQFICTDVYNTRSHVFDQFDIVFTSYGTIGWLPDLNKWAEVIYESLRPGGRLVFVDFHPVVWMMDDDFKQITYRYWKSDPIVEETNNSYTDGNQEVKGKTISWNHGLSEVVKALMGTGLSLQSFDEYDYSPYNCFNDMREDEPGHYRIAHLDNKIPMVYSLVMKK